MGVSEQKLNEILKQIISEYRHKEDNIDLTVEETALPAGLIPEEVQDDLIHAVCACPDGVFRFIDDVPGIVETSNNLAIVKSDGSTIVAKSLLRSSVESRKEELADMVESVFALAGAQVEFSGGYPGWAPNMQSPILQTMKRVYAQRFGQEPKVMIIHAGLECGFFSGKIKGLDCVSIGPDQYDLHTPRERLSISSTERVYKFILEVLKEQKPA